MNFFGLACALPGVLAGAALAQSGPPSFQTPQAKVQAPQAVTVPAAAPAPLPVTNQPSVSVTPTGSASSISPSSATAAQMGPPPFEVYTDYNWGNAMAKKLRNAPAKLYNFDRASLRDVLRFLADDAGIPFVAMQESSAAESTLVTFTLRASPFLALETIAKANGVSLFYENGIWFMRPLNEKELIGRIYKLRYNPQQNVEFQGQGSQSGATTGVQTSSTGSGIPDLNINIQGASEVFEVKTPKIVDELKELLGIPTSGLNATLAEDASVGNFGAIPPPQSINPSGSALTGGDKTEKGDNGAQIVYNADANTIYIIATAQQHRWVEGFLSAVDRPQALIGIEVKFFETTKNPSKDLGINWAGTFGGDGLGINLTDTQVSATGAINVTRDNGTVDNTLNESRRTTPSVAGDGSRVTSTRDFTGIENYQATFSAPYSAVLSVDDMRVAIQAFVSDLETSVVQYPRVLTINNREVVIRSVVNTPVLASTSSVTPGVGGTTTASVSYLPIGTIINVLPKTMSDNSVVLNVAITVSTIIGVSTIQGNSYPIASSRIYNAALQVDSGYTLAVGGLEEAEDGSDTGGIPLLKDIPGLGDLFFKRRGRTQRKKNLIIFITPTIIHDRSQTEGIATSPETTVPKRHDEPSPPAFTNTGRLVGGFAAIDEALAWLELQLQTYKQMIVENRCDKDSVRQLQGVITSAETLIAEIQRMEEESPGNLNALTRKEEKALSVLADLNKTLSGSIRNINRY